MTIRQLSVFVENEQGRLYEIAETLYQSQIDIRALSLADTSEFGILRLIVNDPQRGLDALKNAGAVVSITEVIGVEMKNELGGLAAVLRALQDAQICVEYAYAFISKDQSVAHAILRVEDNARAEQILLERGFVLLTEVY